MLLIDQLRGAWYYTHLSVAEVQQGLAVASERSAVTPAHIKWKSWALTEIVYRDHDVISKTFAIASFLPLVIVIFLSGLASAPCRERRLPALNLLLYLTLSVALNVTLKRSIRSLRPAHPAAGLNYTTVHGMPSDHSQFMAGLVVYLMRRWSFSCTSPNAAVTSPKRRRGSPVKKLAYQHMVPSQRLQKPMPHLLSGFLFSASLFVGAGRVYNGYHTVGQVIAGWAVGAVFAVVCTTASVQQVFSWVSERLVLPVMLVCTYWTNAVC